MRSPAAAMAWQLWRQHRWLAGAGAVWLVTASIVCRLLPANLYNDVVVFSAAVPMLLLLAWQVAVFTHGSEAELSNNESGYPPSMLRHPVSVRLLVGWPMFLGMMTVAAIWTVIAVGIFRGRGVDVWILRPALMCAVVLAWSQALIWSPFGLGWLRIIAVVGVITMVIFTALMDVICGVPNAVIFCFLAVQIPAAYGVAVVGVSRARRGDNPEWRWLPTAMERVATWIPRRRAAFGSAVRAQAWFEWRRHGLGPPLTVGIAMPIAMAFIAVNQMNSDVSDDSLLASPLLLLLLTAYMAIFAGSDFGNLSSTKTDRRVPGFLLTRPISSMDLIRAKYLAAAKCWLIVCLITAVAVAVCMILTGRFGDVNVLRDKLGYDTWWSQAAVVIPVTFLLLWAFGWLCTIQGMFVGLTGRQWVVVAFVTAVGVLFAGMVLLGLWLSMHSEYHQACWKAAPWLVGCSAVVKLALARFVLHRAWGCGVLETRAVGLLVGVWATVVLAATGLVAWLVPSELLPLELSIAGTILAFPLTRIALAPLALAWNRHR